MTPSNYQRLKQYTLWATILNLLIFFLLIATARAETITTEQATRAIVGEAGNQGYKGMLAVACAIRNRGTLKGVYGAKAKHIDNEPKWVWDMASKAWNESAKKDITNGATHWGNKKDIELFKKQKWFKSYKEVFSYKGHKFFKKA